MVFACDELTEPCSPEKWEPAKFQTYYLVIAGLVLVRVFFDRLDSWDLKVDVRTGGIAAKKTGNKSDVHPLSS